MKVKELIKKLQSLPQDATVYAYTKSGGNPTLVGSNEVKIVGYNTLLISPK